MPRLLAAVLAVFLFVSPAIAEEGQDCVSQSEAIEFLESRGLALTEDWKGGELAEVWDRLPTPPEGLKEATTEIMLFVGQGAAVLVFFVNDCAVTNFGPIPDFQMNELLGRTPA